jgi:hypothetical protein
VSDLPAVAEVLVVLFGGPLLLAAAPGFIALRMKRWMSAAVLLIGALLVIGVPVNAKMMASLETPPDVFVCGPMFGATIWAYGASYGLAAGVALALLQRPRLRTE